MTQLPVIDRIKWIFLYLKGEESALDITLIQSTEGPALAPTIDPEVSQQELDLKANIFDLVFNFDY